MAIKSSQKKDTPERVIDGKEAPEDQVNENILRPKRLAEYIGQEHLKRHLGVAIESATLRKTSLEHILLYGPPGLGKTTLAMIVAQEMGVHLKSTSGPAIEKPSDIVSLLTSLEMGDILFIDEIHRLRPIIEELLYSAMEDNTLDIMIGSGTGATSIKMDIVPFTLVGATTRLSALSSPLRDRFGNILKLDFYTSNELASIVLRSAHILGCQISPKIAGEIAQRSRGTPRIANRLLKIIRDYIVVGHPSATKQDIQKIFLDLGIDDLGLDTLDTQFLMHLAHSFGGGPVGLSTLASVLGEEEGTIEDVVEPYLLKIGFLERTPRGRKLSLKGEVYVSGIENTLDKESIIGG